MERALPSEEENSSFCIASGDARKNLFAACWPLFVHQIRSSPTITSLILCTIERSNLGFSVATLLIA